ALQDGAAEPRRQRGERRDDGEDDREFLVHPVTGAGRRVWRTASTPRYADSPARRRLTTPLIVSGRNPMGWWNALTAWMPSDHTVIAITNTIGTRVNQYGRFSFFSQTVMASSVSAASS